jgi:hypothetical protein
VQLNTGGSVGARLAGKANHSRRPEHNPGLFHLPQRLGLMATFGERSATTTLGSGISLPHPNEVLMAARSVLG